ncbi:MAG: NAD(P)H-hydrate dehydratase [Arenibacterium sp.]
MTELLTAAQMRATEQAAIKSGEVTGLELMERAGRGVVEAVFEEWPELAKAPHRAVVLCGPGNNGGDGFVVARLLTEWGWEVEVFLDGDPDKLPPDARVNYERGGAKGDVTIRSIDPPPLVHDSFLVEKDCDLLVDSLFGTGLTRPFRGIFSMIAKFRERVSVAQMKFVAVDVPSGLCADSGAVLGNVIPADLTVTFHASKTGHFLSAGPDNCGKTVIKSIELEARDEGSADTRGGAKRCPAVPPGQMVALVEHLCTRRLGKQSPTHKYNHGHALVLSGPPGTGGAARLAARGALRIGAGLVSVVCETATVAEHASRLTAIMIKQVDGAEGFTALLEDARFNAVCIGPGLGLERARALVAVGLAQGREEPRCVVLDADALTAFAAAPQELFNMLHENCVLTPHGGEFRRLFPDLADKLDAVPVKGPAYSKVDATREAAARAGCVVLFKGPDTVIAHPDGRASINSAHYERAAPWLATAGSGDVLAGFITGLLARGYEPMQAAETAAWLHVECARRFGPGLIAEDLPEQLPAVFRDLGVT